ncbi:restriction endonuclease subunit S [Tenacibaculum maritimum]|uniref:restriction endonuclease subunit S n=1 Tax=Tenacibaculum maritimum TaxID=107401 RepID=UPI0012E5B15F|nr:restriction endonuclease subunit S [Tenacibaculum maritimum]CAA0189946.1 Restriction modification system DNA specificity domain-containing protein [Tenacibaculum maritimum]
MEKYNEYKNSGIEWLGNIPEHWEVRRIKDSITKIGSGVTPKGGSETYVDEGIPLIRSQNVYNDGLRLDNVSFITEEVHNKMKNSQLKPLDILINITGASIGRTCIFPETIKTANINQHIIYLRVKKRKVDYFSYYLKSNTIQEYIMNIQAGSSKEALNMSQILNIGLPFPKNEEQTQIANYLDIKTTTIDKKITLLEQKIKHYKAYRKTLINKIVTKGLDKRVKLKDSGISWIGEVPEHWEVKRIKDIFSISRGRAIGKTELKDTGVYPVYSSQTKNKGILGYINTYDFNTNLLTWTTDGVNAGTVFIREGKFNCTNICGTLTPKKNNKLSLDYMGVAVQQSTQHNKRIDTNGAKIMSNEMAVIDIVFPPHEEQQQIANYLDAKTTIIDKIVNNIEAQITMLKELRKTLINEVVTGKVKVTSTSLSHQKASNQPIV